VSFKARAKKPRRKFPARKPTDRNSASSNAKKTPLGVTLNFVNSSPEYSRTRRNAEHRRRTQTGTVEFASVQYYGYALANRSSLLPTREQLTFASAP